MEEMISPHRTVRVGRAALSFLVLTVFVLIPTIRGKSRFALALARMPVWRRYEFFRVMFDIIEKEKPRGRAA
jgi:hypothetical protein